MNLNQEPICAWTIHVQRNGRIETPYDTIFMQADVALQVAKHRYGNGAMIEPLFGPHMKLEQHDYLRWLRIRDKQQHHEWVMLTEQTDNFFVDTVLERMKAAARGEVSDTRAAELLRTGR